MITVVTPAYNEEGNLRALHERLVAALQACGQRYEWLIVDDASTDATFQVATEIAAADPAVRAYRFSRNFGSHAAILCGLEHSSGDIAVVLAADLQDPPEIIPALLDEIGKGASVVWAAREQREGETFLNVMTSKLFYWVISRVLKVDRTPPKGADFFAITRPVIDSLLRIQEPNLNVFMALCWLGYTQASVPYRKQERFSGTSGWSLVKRFKLAIDSFVASSYTPIRFMSATGLLTSVLGLVYAVTIIYNNIFHGGAVQGWPSLMVITLFSAGMVMSMLGVLGEYVWRSLEASRARPLYIVEKSTSTAAAKGHSTTKDHAHE
ncbi:MAG TPA: glycosyltransferase family 2 protein [Humidesulfovibrio sp.]|uniref:glycosyltransferase family 2 protein n=1 Tax=Humidesulfovibrio sp. TaxID=2910988 RepID=UPI002C3DE224|nr:glycosyltransferase family 2 protein [Humidesulfovibrio sp.]HWR03148.1 glycosyltransferase family 2 protein [Humidesulfovibrio sp.]